MSMPKPAARRPPLSRDRGVRPQSPRCAAYQRRRHSGTTKKPITANAATAGQGTWQWFDGLAWQNVSTSVSTASALVLADNEQNPKILEQLAVKR